MPKSIHLPFARFIIISMVFLMSSLNLALASATAAGAQKTPERVATEFYSWYVKTISDHRDPMSDYPDKLSAYVSQPLIAEVRSAMAAEGGLEADYFIQAQDYLEDWPTNVHASKSTIRGNTAKLELALGASPETRQRLALTLTRENRIWKIRKVRPVQ